jgi:hypothetical protein
VRLATAEYEDHLGQVMMVVVFVSITQPHHLELISFSNRHPSYQKAEPEPRGALIPQNWNTTEPGNGIRSHIRRDWVH